MLASMRRDNVAPTLIRRRFGTRCPLEYVKAAEVGSVVDDAQNDQCAYYLLGYMDSLGFINLANRLNKK